jgi:DNA-binding response OmpR family regulator
MSLKILLIEDDPDDIELLEDALQKFGVTYEMDTVIDGGNAIDYISEVRGKPDIIILDLNLPRVHGKQVILAVKSSVDFRDIPLLILTTSSSADDIAYAYKNGAKKYLQKPTSVDEIKLTVEVIKSLGEGD